MNTPAIILLIGGAVGWAVREFISVQREALQHLDEMRAEGVRRKLFPGVPQDRLAPVLEIADELDAAGRPDDAARLRAYADQLREELRAVERTR